MRFCPGPAAVVKAHTLLAVGMSRQPTAALGWVVFDKGCHTCAAPCCSFPTAVSQ